MLAVLTAWALAAARQATEPFAEARAGITAGLMLVFLYAFHPETPRRLWQWRDRNAYLSAVADAVKGDLEKAPVIVAGDWNTPTWSPFFRSFLRQAGLASTAGGWLQPVTRFSMKLDALAYIGASIDHIAVSPDIFLKARQVGPAFGSNHLPVIADLALPES